MAYSGTLTLPAAETPAGSASPLARRDPISDARTLLHTAGRLSYEAAMPEQWLGCFRASVVAASRAVAAHILRGEREDSALKLLQRDEPRLQPEVSRQLAEHAGILRQIHDLTDEAFSTESPDLWRVVELSEQATLAEIALARHQNRYVGLVYEAANREIGGEAG